MSNVISYPTGNFILGGRVYRAGEKMEGLSEDEVTFYERRGTVNRRPPVVGGVVTRKPAERARPVARVEKPVEKAPEPVVPAEEPVAEEQPSAAAEALAERTRRATQAIAKGGKNGG